MKKRVEAEHQKEQSKLAPVRLVFQQPDKGRAEKELRALAGRLEKKVPLVRALLLEAEQAILAQMGILSEYWRQISSANPLERLNREINRRSRVVGLFPSGKGLVRGFGAVLLEQDDECAVSRQ